jgi:uncharacterized membrane protein
MTFRRFTPKTLVALMATILLGAGLAQAGDLEDAFRSLKKKLKEQQAAQQQPAQPAPPAAPAAPVQPAAPGTSC